MKNKINKKWRQVLLTVIITMSITTAFAGGVGYVSLVTEEKSRFCFPMKNCWKYGSVEDIPVVAGASEYIFNYIDCKGYSKITFYISYYDCELGSSGEFHVGIRTAGMGYASYDKVDWERSTIEINKVLTYDVISEEFSLECHCLGGSGGLIKAWYYCTA